MKAQTEQLTLFAEAFLDDHASRTHLQAKDEAQRMTVTSGLRCSELYKKQSPLGSLVRMCLGSSTWSSNNVFLTWKVQGTKCNRLLFQLARSTPRTHGIGSGYWPTPTARDYKGTRSKAAMIASGRNPMTNNLCDAIEQCETGKLNPMWVEWLMGYPIGYTDLKHLEIV